MKHLPPNLAFILIAFVVLFSNSSIYAQDESSEEVKEKTWRIGLFSLSELLSFRGSNTIGSLPAQGFEITYLSFDVHSSGSIYSNGLTAMRSLSKKFEVLGALNYNSAKVIYIPNCPVCNTWISKDTQWYSLRSIELLIGARYFTKSADKGMFVELGARKPFVVDITFPEYVRPVISDLSMPASGYLGVGYAISLHDRLRLDLSTQFSFSKGEPFSVTKNYGIDMSLGHGLTFSYALNN